MLSTFKRHLFIIKNMLHMLRAYFGLFHNKIITEFTQLTKTCVVT